MRIACIADTHLPAPAPDHHPQFPRQLRSLSAHKRGEIYGRVSREIDRAYIACTGHLRQNPPDVIVHLGDVTGGWGREGIDCPQIQSNAERCAADLRGMGAPMYCCLGNHDWRCADDPLDPEAVTREADLYIATLGPLYWEHIAGGVLAIGICVPLAEYRGKNERMLSMQREQKEFVARVLRDQSDLPWVLYAHSPFAVRHVLFQVAPHLLRCKAIVGGHIHRPIVARLARAVARISSLLPLRGRAFVRSLKRAVICPAAAPLYARGYGMLEITCNGGRVRRREIRVRRPVDSERVPSQSLRWCMRGCLRKRRRAKGPAYEEPSETEKTLLAPSSGV